MHEFIKDDDTCGFMRNKCSGGGVCVCVGKGGRGSVRNHIMISIYNTGIQVYN